MKREIIESVLGKHFADHLDEVILDAGPGIHYSRRDLIEDLGCANFGAARRLERALLKLGITTPLQLFKTDPFSLARVRGVGEATLYVAMCILDANAHDPEQWWGWKQEQNVVKFSTFRARAVQRSRRRKQDVA